MVVPVVYQYRLNENSKYDDMSLEGVKLSKESWRVLSIRAKKLEPHIRSKENKEGIVDYQVYEALSKKIIETNISDNGKVNDIQPIDPGDFTYMSRDEIKEIALAYGINPTRKRNDYLIKLIIEEQKKVQTKKELESDIVSDPQSSIEQREDNDDN